MLLLELCAFFIFFSFVGRAWLPEIFPFEDFAFLPSCYHWLLVTFLLESEVLPLLFQLQDEVILSDSERLRMTQSNVKMVSYAFSDLYVLLVNGKVRLSFLIYLFLIICSFKGIFKQTLCHV